MLSPVLSLNPKTPPQCDHITPVLKKLHWLKIPERIEYKAISLPYNTLQSSHPLYLHQLFTIQPPLSTRSSSALTLLRPSVTSSLKNLTPCYLSTALSLQTENTALQQILS